MKKKITILILCFFTFIMSAETKYATTTFTSNTYTANNIVVCKYDNVEIFAEIVDSVVYYWAFRDQNCIFKGKYETIQEGSFSVEVENIYFAVAENYEFPELTYAFTVKVPFGISCISYDTDAKSELLNYLTKQQ